MVNFSLRHRRPVATGLALAAVISAPLIAPKVPGLLSGLAEGPALAQATPKQQEILLVTYAVTKAAFDKVIPQFRADWKRRTGQEVVIKTSYGGSGSQTRAVIDGLQADVVALALAADTLKLQETGLIRPGWEKENPNNAIFTNSTVAFFVRKGNPKKINGWTDLDNKNVEVVTANPKTSGGARWNFLGLWGSVTETGGNEAKARSFITNVYRNVETLPKDAREATDVFVKRNQGDVLLNYENEAILAKKTGAWTIPYVVPKTNILIEGPVAVVDKNVDRKGTRKVAEAFARYLYSDQVQRAFAAEGFRPVTPKIKAETRNRFAPLTKVFTAKDFGGWNAINKKFFGNSGLWDQIFRTSR
ncbi:MULTISPECIES: sulfate ABC transporter substrate-binding protein [Synechococcales]|uniref:sulfate ABC transporter substrate-binding protein n=1 Tax=Synechococcus sp. CS-1325 TaxID=2847979 RepID=UPI00223A6DBC|nr:sulfate ABC transporter substrate-binding protein [Synechococcus sp. CS-1325]